MVIQGYNPQMSQTLCLHFLDLNRRDAKNAEEKLKETLCSLRLCGKFLSGTRKTAKIVTDFSVKICDICG